MALHRGTPNLIPLALVLSAALAPAQNIVSPLGYETIEGNSATHTPFGLSRPMRYLQIHSDLTGRPRMFRAFTLRQNAGTGNFSGTRQIELELIMGHSVPYDHVVLNYAANYANLPRTTAITRKTVNLGALGPAVTPGPNPFILQFQFDRPFPYLGAGSFAWEALIYRNNSGTPPGPWNMLDAEIGIRGSDGFVSETGKGCIPGDGTRSMQHRLDMSDWGGTLTFAASVEDAPKNALTILSIGFSNPNLAYPGLCTALQSDLFLPLGIGRTDAHGRIPPGGDGTWFAENHWSGTIVFTQMIAFEPTRKAALPLCLSNGLIAQVPVTNLNNVVPVSRLWNSDGSTTTARADFATIGLVNYGLITRFSE